MNAGDDRILGLNGRGAASSARHGRPKPGLISRRRFLGLGAAVAVTSPLFRPFPDDLALLLEDPLGPISPETGEALPLGLAELTREELAGSPFDPRLPLFLTFDDGPLPCTQAILENLVEQEQKATFFVIGRNLTNPTLRKLAIRAVQEGHELGNHSYTHPAFSRLSAHRAAQEIFKTHRQLVEIIQEAGGDPDSWNRFFRFPYGDPGSSWNWSAVRDTLAELGYRIAWWDLDTNDWRMELGSFGRHPSRVVKTMQGVRSRDVVLLHDRNATARLLPRLLAVLDVKNLRSTSLSHYDEAFSKAPATDQPQQFLSHHMADTKTEIIPMMFNAPFSRLNTTRSPKWTHPGPAGDLGLW